MTALEPQASKVDRTVAVLVAPFVLAWDALRSVFFFLCRVMERLDPFAALGRLFGRFSPPLARVFRRFWASTLAFRLRIKELSTRVYGWFLRAIRPAVRAIYPVVRRVGRMIATAARWVAARLARSFETVRRATAPAIRRTRRIWNLAFGTVTAPFRRAAASVRRAVSRGES